MYSLMRFERLEVGNNVEGKVPDELCRGSSVTTASTASTPSPFDVVEATTTELFGSKRIFRQTSIATVLPLALDEFAGSEAQLGQRGIGPSWMGNPRRGLFGTVVA